MTSDHTEAFKKGQSVFFIHPTESWVRGTVTDIVHTKNKAGSFDLTYNCTANLEPTMLPTISQHNALITGLKESKLHVTFDSYNGDEDEEYVEKEPSKTNNYFYPDGQDTFSDLLDLSYLHDSTLLEQIRKRYFADLIYTRIGPIILALNPYNYCLPNYIDSRMPAYIAEGPEVVDNAGKSPLIPHSWHTAHYSYWLLSCGEGNQSVIVSGESGAGKTETAKIVVKYLGEVSTAQCSEKQREKAIELTRRVNKTSPILEAFGNAKTTRNDNSSRFGKFMKVHFLLEDDARKAAEEDGGMLASSVSCRRGGVMVGVSISVYLLEKSRIVTHGKGERGYHSFYLFLARHKHKNEAKEHLLTKLKLKSAKNYTNLNIGNAVEIPGVDDAADYDEVIDSMESIGIGKDVQNEVWSVIGAVIHLLGIQISAVSADECTIEGSGEHVGMTDVGMRLRAASINAFRDAPCSNRAEANKTHITVLSHLLGIDMKLFVKELITTTAVMRGETIVKRLKKALSIDVRDAFAKYLYESLFLWLVSKINDLISPPPETENTWIALLDIFGFENFSHGNSFEQLCINLANETLQNHYNSVVFTRDINECHKEGINTESVKFYDNQPCLDLICGVNFSMCGLSNQSISTTKVNICALLDEECSLGNGSDLTFCHKITELFGKGKNPHVNFKFPKTESHSFIINHYAGEVKYNVHGFRFKNSDSTKDTLRVMVMENSTTFIKQVIESVRDRGVSPTQNDSNTTSKKSSSDTVSTIFKNQLVQLMSEINCTHPHWIRCVKPHSAKMPRMFNGEETMTQMRSAGVLETVRIRQQSFSVRIPFQQFINGSYGIFLKCLPKHTIITMERRATSLEEKAAAKRAEKETYLLSRKESNVTTAKQMDFDTRIERLVKQSASLRILSSAMNKKASDSAKLTEKCSIILQRSGVNESSLSQVGKTKVFLRSEAFQQVHQLEREVRDLLSLLPSALAHGYLSSYKVRCLQINKGVSMIQCALLGRFGDYVVKKRRCEEDGKIMVTRFRNLLLLESEEMNTRARLVSEGDTAFQTIVVQGQRSRDDALDRFASRMVHVYEGERQLIIEKELNVRATDLIRQEDILWKLLLKSLTMYNEESDKRQVIEEEMNAKFIDDLCCSYEKLKLAVIEYKIKMCKQEQYGLISRETHQRDLNEKEEYMFRVLLIRMNTLLTDEMDGHDYIEMEEEEEISKIIKWEEEDLLCVFEKYKKAKAISDAKAIKDFITDELHQRTLLDVEWEQGLISFYVEASRGKEKSLQQEAERVRQEAAEAVKREMARLAYEKEVYDKWVEEEREFAKLIWLAAEKVEIERRNEEQMKVNAKLERLREAQMTRDRIQIFKLKEASSNKTTNRSGGLAKTLENMTDIRNCFSQRGGEMKQQRRTSCSNNQEQQQGSAADQFTLMMHHIDEINKNEDLTPRTKRKLKMEVAAGNSTSRRVSWSSACLTPDITNEYFPRSQSSISPSPSPSYDGEILTMSCVNEDRLVSTNAYPDRQLRPAEVAFEKGNSPLGRFKYQKLIGRELSLPSNLSMPRDDIVGRQGGSRRSSTGRIFSDLGISVDEIIQNPFDKYWRPLEGGRKVYLPNGKQVDV